MKLKLLLIISTLFISSIANARVQAISSSRYNNTGPTRIGPSSYVPVPVRKPVSVAPPKKNYNSRCQSYNHCIFKVDDGYDQSDEAISRHMMGNKNTCAPTAAAILLSGIFLDKKSTTKPLGDMKKYGEAKSRGAKVAVLGKGMGTLNKSKGGTMPFALPFIGDMKTFFKKQFRFSGAREYEQKSYGSLFTYPKRTQADFVNEIRKKKTGYLITVTSHKKKNKRWVREGDTIFRLGGHVMALTGFYGSNIHIDDPWGEKYYVKMKQEKIKTCRFCFKAKKTVLTPTAKNKRGFINNLDREGKKLILRQYIKLKAY